MGLITSSLRKPITVLVVVLAVGVFSLLALQRIAIDIFPFLDLPVIYVSQPYGGMTPQQMEGFFATRYQDQFLYVSGIKNIEVKNITGLSLVKLTFYEGTNMAQAASEVASQVNRVVSYLPPGSVPPTVIRFDAASLPVGQLVFRSNSATLNQLQDLASSRIRSMFSSIPGVSSPPPFGGNARTIVVRANPELLRTFQLTPDDLVKAVASYNKITPAGNLQIADKTYLTPINSVIRKVEEFGGIPLLSREEGTLFLRDVATIEDAADQTVGYALVGGKRAVYIPVTKRPDASTWAVVQNIRKALPEMQALLPDNVQISYEFDQSQYVIHAVESLVSEGAIGALLTGLIVLLFLGDWRSAAIVVITIPISLLAAVLGLSLLGQTINIMTLSGLALAIGILVDEATVTIENIHHHLELKKSKARAVLDACREIAIPKLLILLCIIAVFVPSFLMQGIPKALFLPLSLSVGLAMVASFIISQSMVPILANWWLHIAHSASDHTLGFNRLFEKVKRRFSRTLLFLFQNQALVMWGYAGIVIIVVPILFISIGKDILPQVNSRQFQLRLRAPEGTRLEKMEAKVIATLRTLESLVGADQIEISSAFVGTHPSSYGVAPIFIFNSGSHEAILQVSLMPTYQGQLSDLKESLRAALKKNIPDLRVSFEPIELTDKVMSQGSPTPIEVMVGGKDLPEAVAFAEKIKTELQTVDFLRDVQIGLPTKTPALRILIDHERAARLGLTPEKISRSLVTATASSRFTEKNLWLSEQNGYAYQVQIAVPPYLMNSQADLEMIPLVSGQSRPVLADVAQIVSDTLIGEYDRMGPRRMVSVTANLHQTDLATATAAVNKIIEKLGAPPKGMKVEVRGLSKLLQETLDSLQSGLILAVIVIFLLLAANFQSFWTGAIVLGTIPAVLIGAISLLLLTGDTLNLQSYMGLIMSIGVSVANAILMITQAESLRKHLSQPMTAKKAAFNAAIQRLRPILMTAIAMVVGMIPMALGLGEAGAQSAPLGRAVIGGLVASTVAALFILPLIYAQVQARSRVESVSLDPEDPESKYYNT